MRIPLVIWALLSFCLSTFGQASEQDREWNKPVEPFRIIENIYYVGAAEITSFLITTPKGHILIDAGYAETAPQIERNIASLGFRLSDVRYIVNT
jgi:metallo-beta-lactamase class B